MIVSGIPRIVGLLAVAATLCGCYQLVYRGQDEKNLRRQLHVPSDVRIRALDGSPKSAGFFGREGLQIHAVFEFDEEQLAGYVATMNDPGAWKPEPLVSYSPSRAEEYSEGSMHWRDVPVPAWAESRWKHWSSWPEIRRVRRGRVYCSSITIVPGERVERPDGSHYDSWRYVGRSCAEVAQSGPSSIVTTLGVLDLDKRRLHAYIAFAG